jgi:hypothetical protein
MNDDQANDGCLTCEHCRAVLPDDMDGEHCLECAGEIFGDC